MGLATIVLPRTRFLRLRQLLIRAAGAFVLAALVVAIATGAVYLTSEPALVSLLLEPLSLLLLPGLVISLLAAGPHDFNPATVIYASFAWYFVVFYLALTWRYRRRARLLPGSHL